VNANEFAAGELYCYVVEAREGGTRIDKFVAQRMPETTRASVQRWIDAERVLVDGRVCRAKEKVKEGSRVEVRPDLPPATDAQPDPSVVIDVVFEDEHLLVVNKPAGLVVHPGAGHRSGTMVNGLLARAGFERDVTDPRDPKGQLRPGIVHRIDRYTSGLLVVAKTAQSREFLKEQLARHSVLRTYIALTVGVPNQALIETKHGRDPHSRLRFSSKVANGKRALTRVHVVERLAGGQAALVECRLETGRTHQIRVHLSMETQTPILGDDLYGGMRGAPLVVQIAQTIGRQALHAKELGFVHPGTRQQINFSAEVPADMSEALRALRQL